VRLDAGRADVTEMADSVTGKIQKFVMREAGGSD
jgi:hypothetical protein